MLVLSRKAGEGIRIGDSVELVVLAIEGRRVRLGFTGPKEVTIHRQEVERRIKGGAAAPPPGKPTAPEQPL